MNSIETSFVLKLQCPDKPGIVAAVSGFLAAQGCNITKSSQFEDLQARRFFMRTCFSSETNNLSEEQLRAEFDAIGKEYTMDWSIIRSEDKPRILIMVSKLGHCLVDLLHRYHSGLLPVDLSAIVSNHPDMAPLAKFYGVPFHHWPCTNATKTEQESRVLRLIEDQQVDLVILARYMQILSDGFCEAMSGRIINIHHSFLPSFKGARPYHQAHARGVEYR